MQTKEHHPNRNREELHVIGYPKSGTTWVTRLLGDALNSPTGSGTGNHRSELAAEGADRPGPCFVLKSHFSKADKPDHITSNTKIVYVWRDYRDVLISSFFHSHRVDEDLIAPKRPHGVSYGRWFFWRQLIFPVDLHFHMSHGAPLTHGDNAWQIFCNLFHGVWALRLLCDSTQLGAALDKRNRQTQRFPRLQLALPGQWQQHIRYWAGFSRNVVPVKYEDLLDNAEEILRAVFRKLSLPCDESRLRDAVERQSFDRRKNSFAQAGDKANYQFMRKGQSGDYKRFLTGRLLTKTHTIVQSAHSYLHALVDDIDMPSMQD